MAIWGAFSPLLQGAAQSQGLNNYALTCNSGSYSVTGSSATISRNRAVTASSGAYSYTGSSATLAKIKDYRLTANSGSYSVTGRAAEIRYVQILPASVAHLLTEAGDNLAQEDGFLLAIEPLEFIVTAGSWSYSYTGQNATLTHGHQVTGSAGAYTLSGQTATLLRNRSLTASSGSYTLTGQTATIRRSKSVTANSGSYALTGQTATLSKNRALTASSGSYTITGQNATVLRSKVLSATAGSYSLTGQSADLYRNRSLESEAGTYALTGQAADITYTPVATGYSITAEPGAYVITGQSASLTIAQATQAGGAGGSRKPKRVYVEQDGKVLVFQSPSKAAEYLRQQKRAETAPEAPQRTIKAQDVPVRQFKEIQPVQTISLNLLQDLAIRFGYQDTLSPLLRKHEYDALISLYEQVLRDRERDEEEVLMLLLA